MNKWPYLLWIFVIIGLCASQQSSAESGGPDSFGYTFKDSNETDGPTYSWIDVSSNGTHINLGGDGAAGAYSLGFDFFFYGNWYDQWWLSGDNGLITLDKGISNYWIEKPIPDISADMVAIAPFWNDLQQCSTTEDGVYYQLIGNETNQALVIQYQGFKEYGGNNCNGKAQYNFQIIIFENTGNLIFNYKPDFENGVPERNVSIGIQGNHETGLQYYYGVKENLSSNFSILFEPNYNLVNRLQIIDIVSPGYFSYGVNEETFVTIKNIGQNDVININFNLKFISQDNIVIHNTTKNIEFIEGKNKINISKIITPAQFDLIPGENITIRCSLKLGNSSQIIDMMETNVLVKYMFFEERFQGNYGVHPWYGDWDYSESDNWERTGYSIGTGEDLSMFSGYRCNGNRPTLSSITSPSIDLTLGKNVWMEFSHSYYFYSSYSGARLEIGLGEGNGPITGWWPLTPEGEYPGIINDGGIASNPIRGVNAWTNYGIDFGMTNWEYGIDRDDSIGEGKVYINLSSHLDALSINNQNPLDVSDITLRWSVGFGSHVCDNYMHYTGYGFDDIFIYENGDFAKHDVAISYIESEDFKVLDNKISIGNQIFEGLLHEPNGTLTANLKNYGIYDIELQDVSCELEIWKIDEEGNSFFSKHTKTMMGTLHSGQSIDVQINYTLHRGYNYTFTVSTTYGLDLDETNDKLSFTGQLTILVYEENDWDGWSIMCEDECSDAWELINGTWNTGNDFQKETYNGNDNSIVSPVFDLSSAHGAYIILEHSYRFSPYDGGRIEICVSADFYCTPITALDGVGYNGEINDYAYYGNPIRGSEGFINSNAGTTIIRLDEEDVPEAYIGNVSFKFRMGGSFHEETFSSWTIYSFSLYSNGKEITGNSIDSPESAYMSDTFSISANYTNKGTENIDFLYVQTSISSRGAIYASDDYSYISYKPITNLDIEKTISVVFNFTPTPEMYLQPSIIYNNTPYEIEIKLVRRSPSYGTAAVDSCAPSEFSSAPNKNHIHHPNDDSQMGFYCYDKLIPYNDINLQNNLLEGKNITINNKLSTIDISDEYKIFLEESNYTFIEGQENEIIITTNDPDGYVEYLMWRTNHTGELWKVDCYQGCMGEGSTPIYLNDISGGLHLLTMYAVDNYGNIGMGIEFNVTILADSDGDGVIDSEDAFPFESTQISDRDNDGYGDNPNGTQGDAFPDDPSEALDTDQDGMGDNADECPTETNGFIDPDGDGYCEISDACPDDLEDWSDSDSDGVCDNADEFPSNAAEWVDTDRDGYGDNEDLFPNNYNEWYDTDGDGIGDNSDMMPGNRFFHAPWQLLVFTVIAGLSGISVKHGYHLFKLSTKVDNKIDEVKKIIFDLNEKGINTKNLDRIVEEVEEEMKKWTLK